MEHLISPGDKIVTTIAEHHSNFVPWQQLAKRSGAKFEVLDINGDGELPESELEKIRGAKLVAIAHASNVLGSIYPIKEICSFARDEGVVSIVDGAQSIPHIPVDVRRLGCDFLAFSGHKMLGPTGIGILYGQPAALEMLEPSLYGGEMISQVGIEQSGWNALPYRLEAGTQPIAEVMGLLAAVDYLTHIGMERIAEYEQSLTRYAMRSLSSIKGLHIYGPPADRRVGVISFTLDSIHPHDIATLLDEKGVAVRSGHHCAMPLHTRLGITATARASFYLYTIREEIDALTDALEYAKTVFRV